MRRLLLWGAAGLCLAALAAPARAGLAEKETPACGSFGTSVEFAESPAEAAKQARKQEKLVFILHVSGNFEDPKFTWNNAEALRVNALANPEVGKYLNEYFVSSYQKVATFKIVGKQKQGGNVASYFCAPDGRVLHVVAGPVDAATMLREAKWVVESTKKAIAASKGDGAKFKAYFRKLHADRLNSEYGIKVEPVLFDPTVKQDPNSALTFNDPTGQPLAPVLPPPPIDGPNVSLPEKAVAALQTFEAKKADARALKDKNGNRWVLGNQGRVHMLMAAHSMVKIERVYGSIFEGILGEKISTKPVEVVTPFPWRKEGRVNELKAK